MLKSFVYPMAQIAGIFAIGAAMLRLCMLLGGLGDIC